MIIEVEARESTGELRFRHQIMSSTDPSIHVSQSLNGAFIFVDVRGQSYCVSVEKIAVTIAEQVLAGGKE